MSRGSFTGLFWYAYRALLVYIPETVEDTVAVLDEVVEKEMFVGMSAAAAWSLSPSLPPSFSLLFDSARDFSIPMEATKLVNSSTSCCNLQSS